MSAARILPRKKGSFPLVVLSAIGVFGLGASELLATGSDAERRITRSSSESSAGASPLLLSSTSKSRPNPWAGFSDFTFQRSQPNDFYRLLHKIGDEDFYLNGNKPPEFEENAQFNITPGSKCAKGFFPGARMPVLESIPREEQLPEGYFDRSNILPNPNVSPSGRVQGCSMTSLKWNDGRLLLRREVSMKNDRFGMVFWMAMKSTNWAWSFNTMRFQLTYKVALYERTDGRK